MPRLSQISASLLGCALLASASALALAQTTPPPTPVVGTPISPAVTYGKLLTSMEEEFVSAAEAMPEEKYNFAPTQGEFKGVRTFAEEVKHVAESNYYFFAGPAYTEAADKAQSASIDKLTSKADILKALKDSFAKAHSSVDKITAENAFIQTSHGTRAGMAAFGLAHFMDHYGQMVEYLRMNGIIPPASRSTT